jgi:hypothetical protein
MKWVRLAATLESKGQGDHLPEFLEKKVSGPEHTRDDGVRKLKQTEH